MFELNLSLAELEKRTSKECFKEYPLLKPDSKEYLSLSDNERTVLGSLLSIAKLIESVHFKLENEKNEEFIKFLDEEIKKGNRQAELSARLFYAQKSMFSPDREGKQIKLVKIGQCYLYSVNYVMLFYLLSLQNNLLNANLLLQWNSSLNYHQLLEVSLLAVFRQLLIM